MKHFSLWFGVSVAAVVLMAAACGAAFASGLVAPGCLAAIGAVCAIRVLCRYVWKPYRRMESFVQAIEMNDPTMRMPVPDNPVMRRTAEAMNRVLVRHRADALELETKKLYYDRILRIMSHELRNSITPIVSLSSDMLAHPDRYEGETFTEAVELMHTQSEGIKNFLDSYYRLTHLPRPEKTDVDMVQFLKGVKQATEVQAAERGFDAGVVRFVVANGMHVSADANLLRQALANVISNALDAVAEKADPAVQVSATNTSGHAMITVADNGCGMDEATLATMFQPFFTTKPSGSGIGLYLTRQILRMHGGDVRLESSPRRGTTVTLLLP